MTKKALFKQSDIERAIRALKSAGQEIKGVEINRDGSFRVLAGGSANDDNLSPLEKWERANGLRAA